MYSIHPNNMIKVLKSENMMSVNTANNPIALEILLEIISLIQH